MKMYTRQASCALAILFVAVGALIAGVVDPQPSLRFKFEGQSELLGSPTFRFPKVDYNWGELEKHDSVARLFKYEFYPSNPNQKTAYIASLAEWFVLDGKTIIVCAKNVESEVPRVPTSLSEAKEMHHEFFSKKTNEIAMRRYFETAPRGAQDKLLAGYSFLGMTPDGPIWRLASPISIVGRASPVFKYKSANRIQYRFELDENTSLFTRCSIALQAVDLPSEQQPNALSNKHPIATQSPFVTVSTLSDFSEDEKSFVVASKSIQDPNTPKEQIVQSKQRIFDLEITRSGPIAMVLSPSDGDIINSVSSPQIKYEWRDGKIATIVNPYLVDDAGSFRFRRSRRWIIAVNFGIVTLLLALVYLKWRKRSSEILSLAILLSTANGACASDVYCGVYSLFGAAKSLGIDVDLEKLIDPKYISSNLGSTAQDLVNASESIGLEATPLWGLGIESLKAAEQPLILHAAPMGIHAAYQHWILFLGFDGNGQARVVDGCGGVALCTVEEVLARWDGVAIAVRDPRAPPTRYLSTELAGLSFLVAYGGVFSLIIKSGLLARHNSVRRWQSAAWIHLTVLIAASVCIGYAAKGHGFRNAARGIDSALGLSHLSRVAVEELPSKLQQGAILVDCRYKGDYELAHIENAISLPIDVGLGDFNRILSNIDRDAEVIVYCQSSKCRFSDYAATMLAGAGFRNVAVFDGGFETWEKHHGDE